MRLHISLEDILEIGNISDEGKDGSNNDEDDFEIWHVQQFYHYSRYNLHHERSMSQLMQYLARLYDTWIDYLVENIESFASWSDESIVSEKCEMLGKVGLWKFGDRQDVFNRSLLELENIKNLETLGVCQDLVDQCILLICLFWEW